MIKKAVLSCFFVILSASACLAWTSCPPPSLQDNPSPIISGNRNSCIIEANWIQLNLNEEWSKKVALEEGQVYWFSASKCARAHAIAGEVKDEQGNVLKSSNGSNACFCFRAPKTGYYTVGYRVTELNGSNSSAITSCCLSRSNCSP